MGRNLWWTGKIPPEKVRGPYPTLGGWFRVSGGEGPSGVILAGPFKWPSAGLLGTIGKLKEQGHLVVSVTLVGRILF